MLSEYLEPKQGHFGAHCLDMCIESVSIFKTAVYINRTCLLSLENLVFNLGLNLCWHTTGTMEEHYLRHCAYETADLTYNII